MNTNENDALLCSIRQILLNACGKDTQLSERTVRLIQKELLTSRSREQLVSMVAHVENRTVGSAVSTPKQLLGIATALLALEEKNERAA